ncbi:hypothetical protein KUE00_18530 [Erwiniaceae bacterium CMYE1]|nr:hypothetical protein [Erwinia phyllosphaerae]
MIPHKIHYIWIGTEISLKDMCNIIHNSVVNKSYQIIIWTDDIGFLRKTARQYEFPSSRLQVKNINTVFPRLKNMSDKDNLLSNSANFLHSLFLRMSHGYYANFACASDIARLVILYIEGGIYFDADVKLIATERFEIDDETDLRIESKRLPINITAPSGLLIGGNQERYPEKGFINDKIGNAILAAPAGSEIVRELLLTIKENFTIKNDNAWGYGKTNMRYFSTLCFTGPYLFTDVLVKEKMIPDCYIMENTTGALFEKLNAAANWIKVPKLKTYRVSFSQHKMLWLDSCPL